MDVSLLSVRLGKLVMYIGLAVIVFDISGGKANLENGQ
jgi:hypothetical protein